MLLRIVRLLIHAASILFFELFLSTLVFTCLKFMYFSHSSIQYFDGGHTIKQLTWASPDLCTPLLVPEQLQNSSYRKQIG